MFFIWWSTRFFLIAKFVIPKDVEKKIKELKIQVKNNKIEKKIFLKNLIWVITNYTLGASKNLQILIQMKNIRLMN